MIYINPPIIAFILLFVLNMSANLPAQEAPSQLDVNPAIPDSWEKYEVRGKRIISRKVDKTWVLASRSDSNESNSTIREIDFPKYLVDQRDLLVAKICKDSSILSPDKVEQFIDRTLKPKIESTATQKTTLVYYVMTDEAIKQAILSGWKNNYFKYDPDRDQLDYRRTIDLSPKGNSDTIIPATFNGLDTEKTRIEQLQKYIQSVENAVISGKNTRISATFLSLTADFLTRESFKDYSNEEDQQWFTIGLTHVLAIQYLSELTKTSPATLVESVITGPLPPGVKSADQNLLLSLDVKSIKDDAIPAFREARKRKSIAVMFDWYKGKGQDKLQETLLAVNRSKPADGETLVRIIKDVSGQDLTEKLIK